MPAGLEVATMRDDDRSKCLILTFRRYRLLDCSARWLELLI